mmetsp:Transcript_9262/g.33955  ORF Transcript_9262/g.33955 Transcript_9262/m.33955 type:complete len:92 (-) Transcript_9262:2-277(-)
MAAALCSMKVVVCYSLWRLSACEFGDGLTPTKASLRKGVQSNRMQCRRSCRLLLCPAAAEAAASSGAYHGPFFSVQAGGRLSEQSDAQSPA